MIISEYRADKRFSQSDVKKFLELTPERFFYQYRNKKQPTEAMVFGAALHNYLLDPETFNDFYIVDTWDKRRAGKEFKAHQETMEEIAGARTILKLGGHEGTDKGFNTIQYLANFFKSKPIWRTITNEKNKNEHSLYGEINGVPVKGQLDIYREGVGIIDLKFTEKEIDKRHQLNRVVVDGRFDIQAFFYIELVKQNYGVTVPFHFKIISWKERPILFKTVEISYAKTPDILENAKMQVENSLFEMEQLRDKQIWEEDRNIVLPTFPDYLYSND